MRASKFSEYLIRGSYVELYNEDIRDLLAGGGGGGGGGGEGLGSRDDEGGGSTGVDLRLKIAEDPKTGPYVKVAGPAGEPPCLDKKKKRKALAACPKGGAGFWGRPTSPPQAPKPSLFFFFN